MTATVRSLGYLVLETADLPAWREFATEILGMQVAEETEDRIRFRIDEYAYRFDVHRAEADGQRAIGWEVGGPKELDEIVGRLRAAGYEVTEGTPEGARQRLVSGYATFRDPDDLMDIELFHALKTAGTYFASPLGHRFVAGRELGFGHVFQAVTDEAKYAELYYDILGFRLSDHIDFAGGRVGTFVHCNPRHHSYAFANTPTAPMLGHAMVEVESVNDVGVAYDKVLKGRAPLTQTFGRHSNDKMISFYCKSPSNLSFEFGTAGELIDDATWTPTRYDTPHYWGHNRERPGR